MTGKPLEETLGILAQTRVLVSNDSGLYHCACALGVPVVVLFTFTSVIKNFDKRFHRTACVVGAALDCRKDCHAEGRWRKCACGMKCRDIPVEEVFSVTMGIIGEE